LDRFLHRCSWQSPISNRLVTVHQAHLAVRERQGLDVLLQPAGMVSGAQSLGAGSSFASRWCGIYTWSSPSKLVWKKLCFSSMVRQLI
jgi:hypothetical protein